MQYTVTAPAAGFTGRRAGVYFVGGSVTLDDDNPAHVRPLAFFMGRDYKVTPVDVGELIDAEIEAGALEVVTVTDESTEDRPNRNASAAAWLDYATRVHGFVPDPEDEATRAELIHFVEECEAAKAEAPVGDSDEDGE